MTWYRIEAPAPGPCGGISVDPNNRITGGAPVFGWMFGKPLATAQTWCRRKNWTIEPLARTTTPPCRRWEAP